MLLLSVPLFAAALLTSLILAVLFVSWRTTRRYQHLPWVGTERPSWWALPYIRITNWANIKHDYASACEKYWLKGQACFIPMLMSDLVVLPPTDFEWALDEPDESFSIHEQTLDFNQAEHTLCSTYVLDTLHHDKTISRDLTRRVGDLTPPISEELALAIDEVWGTNCDNWRDVNPFTTLIRVVARVSNCVFVSAPLCRDPDFIDTAIAFANTVIPTAYLIRLFPKSLRSIVAPIITFKNRAYRRKLREVLIPEVMRRLQEAQGGPEKPKSTTYNDYLQWSINAALKSDLPRDREVDILVERIMLVNFASIHTTTISVTNAIFDLASRPSSQETISSLREEADAAFAANNGVWTKADVGQLFKIDSALKESIRLGQLSGVGWNRVVTSPGGITAPTSGTFIPQGSFMGLPIYMMHRDARIYPDPEAYQPFRFADLRSVAAPYRNEIKEDSKDTPSTPKATGLPLTSTSQSFVTFGHGRHACPGRFLAANELKLLLAYVMRNYDFDLLDQRPERPWFGQSVICPMDKTVRIRRREKQ